MAIYEIQSPDGVTHEIEGPDDATQDQIMSFFQSSYQAPESPAQIPDYMTDMLSKSGMDQADMQRLTATGITPGTAAEFAGAHIQANRAQGNEPTPEVQQAIFDIYKRQSG